MRSVWGRENLIISPKEGLLRADIGLIRLSSHSNMFRPRKKFLFLITTDLKISEEGVFKCSAVAGALSEIIRCHSVCLCVCVSVCLYVCVTRRENTLGFSYKYLCLK